MNVFTGEFKHRARIQNLVGKRSLQTRTTCQAFDGPPNPITHTLPMCSGEEMPGARHAEVVFVQEDGSEVVPNENDVILNFKMHVSNCPYHEHLLVLILTAGTVSEICDRFDIHVLFDFSQKPFQEQVDSGCGVRHPVTNDTVRGANYPVATSFGFVVDNHRVQSCLAVVPMIHLSRVLHDE